MFRVLMILFLCSSIFFASGGSVYSRYGTGDRYHYIGAKKMSLGTPAIASPFMNDIDNVNPAAWYRTNITRYNIGMHYNGIELDDGANKAYHSEYDFSGLLFGVPISNEYGVVLVAGIVPYTKVNYEVLDEPKNAGIEYQSKFVGEGSITKAFLGLSYATPLGFSVGSSFDYYTGKIDYTTEIDFTSSGYDDSEYLNRQFYYGVGFNFGLLSDNLSEYLSSESITDFRLGANFNYISELKTDTSLTVITSGVESERSNGLTDTKLPFKMGLGASIVLKKNYTFLLDYTYEPWSEYEFANVTDEQLKDLSRISLGFEYKDRSKTEFSGFWEQVALRCGLSYESLKYKVSGEDLNQMMLHAGFSLPMGAYNDVDFGFAYGFRGTNDSNLIKENVFNFAVTFNFGDLWFVRQDR